MLWGLLGLAAILWGATAQAAPVVSNVSATQRTDGSMLVDVSYDLAYGAEPIYVTILFSSDNGVTWNVTPAPGSLTGDVGPGVTNGPGKHIVWDAGRDRPGVRWLQTGVRVLATEALPVPTPTP